MDGRNVVFLIPILGGPRKALYGIVGQKKADPEASLEAKHAIHSDLRIPSFVPDFTLEASKLVFSTSPITVVLILKLKFVIIPDSYYNNKDFDAKLVKSVYFWIPYTFWCLPLLYFW